MRSNDKHGDYFLVVFDDHNGNVDTEGNNKEGIVFFLKQEGFRCEDGYYSIPWYFVDIKEKFFIPGRPGVKFGEIIGNHAITFEEFKIIYQIYKKYEGLKIMEMRAG